MTKLVLQIFLFERAGWVECWTVPCVVFTIDYSWHPIYPQKADEQLKQSCKCKSVFFLSIFHFRKCCDRVGSNFFNLQKSILNWTAFFFHFKPDNIFFNSRFQKISKFPVEKKIISIVNFSLSTTVDFLNELLSEVKYHLV